MEDAATAEISRSQLWQWVRHNARTAEGKEVTAAWVEQLLKQVRTLYMQIRMLPVAWECVFACGTAQSAQQEADAPVRSHSAAFRTVNLMLRRL
eukprot:352561-Chlamydomonas_euryale.AAC.3